MLGGPAVVASGAASRDLAPAPPWWRDAVIYQVYPRSFADSNGDGVGDLPGITAHLDHLVELGVDAVWLSPFYPSPQADAGYDISDHRGVDPVFGTLADADALLVRAHELGLRVVVDIVPNHTSDEHPWFAAALAAGPGSPERARYLFRDGRDGGQAPPNNWTSRFGGPAWTRVTGPDGLPEQWYLHLFDTKQPDLDWTSLDVVADFDAILAFWLDRGVDGFRVDVAHGLVKAAGLPDWDPSQAEGLAELLDGDVVVHAQHDLGPMWDQDGVHDIYRRWRGLLDARPGDPAMVAEAWAPLPGRLVRYVRPDEFHQAFNFAFLASRWEAGALRRVITSSLADAGTVGAVTTWVLSNHDVVRHASRLGLAEPGGNPEGVGPADAQPDAALGLRRARAATLLELALPGSAYLYQGEELGLPDHTTLDDSLRQDPQFARTGGAVVGRDGARVPLPWRAAAPAFGFSPTGASWLPQPAAFAEHALDAQRGRQGSTYELYRRALRLRREHGLGRGELVWADPPPGADVLAFTNGGVGVVVNLGRTPVPLPPGRVVLASVPDAVAHGALAPDAAVWMT